MHHQQERIVLDGLSAVTLSNSIDLVATRRHISNDVVEKVNPSMAARLAQPSANRPDLR